MISFINIQELPWNFWAFFFCLGCKSRTLTTPGNQANVYIVCVHVCDRCVLMAHVISWRRFVCLIRCLSKQENVLICGVRTLYKETGALLDSISLNPKAPVGSRTTLPAAWCISGGEKHPYMLSKITWSVSLHASKTIHKTLAACVCVFLLWKSIFLLCLLGLSC